VQQTLTVPANAHIDGGSTKRRLLLCPNAGDVHLHLWSNIGGPPQTVETPITSKRHYVDSPIEMIDIFDYRAI